MTDTSALKQTAAQQFLRRGAEVAPIESNVELFQEGGETYARVEQPLADRILPSDVENRVRVGAPAGEPDLTAYVGSDDPSDILRTDASVFADDRSFISATGPDANLSVYETEARENLRWTVGFEGDDPVEQVGTFINRVRSGTAAGGATSFEELGIDVRGSRTPSLEESADRRETREAAREAAENAGVDLDEFGIGATAEGEVILQDHDTGRTRRIDGDTAGGLGDAIDAETSGGEFVADSADPAAGSTSGGGLGARAVAAIMLLLGAIAAAVGWSG